MNYKNEFKIIIKICKFVFPIIILLSPFLLLFYLKNINSHAFFIDLINDSYIFTILGVVSIIIALSLLFIYILPSFLWFITKSTSNYDFEKKQKIIGILKKSDKKKDFEINKFNFMCICNSFNYIPSYSIRVQWIIINDRINTFFCFSSIFNY